MHTQNWFVPVLNTRTQDWFVPVLNTHTEIWFETVLDRHKPFPPTLKPILFAILHLGNQMKIVLR